MLLTDDEPASGLIGAGGVGERARGAFSSFVLNYTLHTSVVLQLLPDRLPRALNTQ